MQSKSGPVQIFFFRDNQKMKRKETWWWWFWSTAYPTIMLVLITVGLATLYVRAAIAQHRSSSTRSHVKLIGPGGHLQSPKQHLMVTHEPQQNEFIHGSPLEPQHHQFSQGPPPLDPHNDKCQGKYVYLYTLPPEFNEHLVDKCGRITGRWEPLCGMLTNNGYGPSVPFPNLNVSNDTTTPKPILEPPHAWFRTEQFSLELLFHHRLKSYPCLTTQPHLAHVFFIPFYAALDSAFTLFQPRLHVRDRLAHRLFGWLRGNPVWTEFNSRKHFVVLGRITWDFSRLEEALDGWGTSLLDQPEMMNFTKLLIERKTWTNDEIAIPYPTSFHPSSPNDVRLWQEKLRERIGLLKRVWLCSFIGSKSRGSQSSKLLREALTSQCDRAKGKHICRQVTCADYESPGTVNCAKSPEQVTTVFLSSTFCLQPPGDSPTRKGLFDSLLAGCIPVLFLKNSAYTQYTWHLPKNGSIYSIFFDLDDVVKGKIDVIASLKEIAKNKSQLVHMQETIIKLIPNIIYALPTYDHSNITSKSGSYQNYDQPNYKDAFDIAIDNLLAISMSHGNNID